MTAHRPVAGRPARGAMGCACLALSVLSACSTAAPPAPQTSAGKEDGKVGQALRLAQSVQQNGDIVAAALFYRRALILEPNNADALTGLAQLNGTLGARDDAIRTYARAVDARPDDPTLRFDYGKALLQNGQPEAALEQYEAFSRLAPSDPRGDSGRGIALDLSGRHDEAQQAYIDGLLKSPQDGGLRNNLALSLALSGRYGEALRLLETVQGEERLTGRAKENRALVHALNGEWNEAIALAGDGLGEAQRQAKLVSLDRLRSLRGPELAAAVFGVARPATAGGATETQSLTANTAAARSPLPASAAGQESTPVIHAVVPSGMGETGRRGATFRVSPPVQPADVVAPEGSTAAAVELSADGPPPERKQVRRKLPPRPQPAAASAVATWDGTGVPVDNAARPASPQPASNPLDHTF